MPRRKAKQKKQTGKSTRTVLARVDYVLQCIRDQPWLDGNRRALARHVMDRFNCAECTAKDAVTAAFNELNAIREENAKDLVGYLDRVHRSTIELGQRTKDGRVITPAAAELRKLHGVGEPDKVHHSGSIGGGVSTGDRALLEALKLTNAQRLAGIDQLRAELGINVGDGVAPTVHPGEDLTVPEDEERSDEQGQGSDSPGTGDEFDTGD